MIIVAHKQRDVSGYHCLTFITLNSRQMSSCIDIRTFKSEFSIDWEHKNTKWTMNVHVIGAQISLKLWNIRNWPRHEKTFSRQTQNCYSNSVKWYMTSIRCFCGFSLNLHAQISRFLFLKFLNWAVIKCGSIWLYCPIASLLN